MPRFVHLWTALWFAALSGAAHPAEARPAGQPENALGRALFLKHCHVCHPGGGQGTGPSLKTKVIGSFRMKTQIRMGKGKMPAFPPSQLNRADLQQLVAYLQDLAAPPPASRRK